MNTQGVWKGKNKALDIPGGNEYYEKQLCLYISTTKSFLIAIFLHVRENGPFGALCFSYRGQKKRR
jgi:hypothetical protein